MAVCDYCGQEMTGRVGCALDGLREWARIPWNGDMDCHDCRCPPGTLHHPGCDAERCADCGGQAISCGCHDSQGGDDGRE